MQDTRSIVPGVSSHAEVSLEIRLRDIKLLWKVDNLLNLSDLDNGNGCPFKTSQIWFILRNRLNITYRRGDTQHRRHKTRCKRLEEVRPSFQLPLQP